MGVGFSRRKKAAAAKLAAQQKAASRSAQGIRERAALAQAQAEVAKRNRGKPKRRGPISNVAIKGAAIALQARAAQILGQKRLSTVAAVQLTARQSRFLNPGPKRKDPRILAREREIAGQIAAVQRKINEAKRDAQTSANRRAQKNRSAILGSARFRSNTRTKKQLQAEASRQSANAILTGKAKVASIEASGQATIARIRALLSNPSKENVQFAGQIARGVSTKRQRQSKSAAASATAARAGTVASKSFATGGSAARTIGQEKAAISFAKQQSRTSVARARKSSTLTQKAPTVTRQKVVGLQVFGPSKTVFAPAILQKKVVKVKTKTLTGPSSQVQKDAQLKAAQLDIQKRFPTAVAKASGLTTQQVRNLTIQGKAVVPTSRTTVKKITKTIKSSEEKKQQIRDLGLTPTERKVTLVNTPAVQVIDDRPIGQQNIFDPNISQDTGISTTQDKAASLQNQGLAIGDLEPDGKVTVLRSNGKITRVTPSTAQGLADRGLIATGFDVETTFRSGDSRPQGIDISSKSLIAPTRDQDAAFPGGTPVKKSKAQLRQETLAFRAGQSPNVNLFDIAIDRRSKGLILGPGESISKDGVGLQGTELEAVLRIREEQDVGRIANALQAQKFQAITGSKSGVKVLAGLQKQEALGLQTIIEPQFTFGTQQGPSDVPFFEDRERIGGVDSPEQLAVIQQRLDETPRPSLKETLGFGVPISSIETKFTPRELAGVTTGNEQGVEALGFPPANIESGLIPKAEGSLASIPNPTQTFNPSVLGSVKNQFGGFNFLQAQNQQALSVQSLSQKSNKVSTEQGFDSQTFNLLTKDITKKEAREFKFTKKDSIIGQEIDVFGRKTTPGELIGGVLTPAIITLPALVYDKAIGPTIEKLGGPKSNPIRNKLQGVIGDFGTSFGADLENELITVQNIPNIPGAVSDVATGKVGSDRKFIEFNPTIQDLLIGGVIQSATSSAIPRAIVSTPNAQGLVQAQLKDGTVIQTTVQDAQRLADSKELKTIGGGGADQFKTEQSQLFSNLAVLSAERPGALAGSSLELGVAAFTGAKLFSFGAKALKSIGKAGKSARINKSLSKELPSVEIPTDLPKVSKTVSGVGEATAKSQKDAGDVLTGGSFGKSFKDLFKTQKKPSDSLTETQINKQVKLLQKSNKEKGIKLSNEQARSLYISTVNRKRPLGDLGLSDADLVTQERLFKANKPIISISKGTPIIRQQIDFFKERSKVLRGDTKLSPGPIQSIGERFRADKAATNTFKRNLQKAIDDAAEGKKTAGDSPKPPGDVGGLIAQYSKANNVTLRIAKKELTKSGAIKKGASNTDALGNTAKKASNDVRVIQDIKRGKIGLDDGRDILTSVERQRPKTTVQQTALLTQKGSLKTVDNIFTGVLVGNKLKQVPTKIVRKGDDFARVPDTRRLDDLGKITNVEGIFQRTTKLGKGVDDLSSLGTTAKRALQSSGQIFEEAGEGVAKKGSKGGGQILKRPRKVPTENPTLKQFRKDSSGGIGKLPKAFTSIKSPSGQGNKLFGIITPKLISRVDDDFTQGGQDFGQVIDITQRGGLKQQPAESLSFFQGRRQSGQLRQPRSDSLRSRFAPKLSNQFTFDFGEFRPPRTRGRARFGGIIIPGGRAETGFSSRDNSRRFFRVFDVGRDKRGNPVPFGQVSRGLGVQVQAAAPIFEIEDVLGRRRAKRPRQEEALDITF